MPHKDKEAYNLARGFFGYCPHEKEQVKCA